MVLEDMEAYGMRAMILTAIITILLSTPVCAGAKMNGDPSGSGGEYEPFLVNCTGYISNNDVGSHGDPVHDGMIAGHPAWYGMTVVIYEAIPAENGTYKIGGYIETARILDTGYGSSTGDGIHSRIREDRNSRGTIETGQSIDKWFSSLKEAKDWMRYTGGHVFIQLISGNG